MLRDFLVGTIGPAARAQLPGAKFIYPDISQFVDLGEYVDPYLSDSAFMSYADIFGAHSYGSPYPGSVLGGYPPGLAAGRRVWVSEGAPARIQTNLDERYDPGSATDLDNGLECSAVLARGISAGVSSWQWWWFRAHDKSNQPYGPYFWKDMAVGLRGPTATAYPDPDDPGADRRRFWMLGNWSRFVRPGWRRVEASATGDAELFCNAFVDGTGRLAVVLVNAGAGEKPTDLQLSGASTPSSVTPFLTDLTHNLEPMNHVSLSGGSLSYTVPARSVVTLYGGLSARSDYSGGVLTITGTRRPGTIITVRQV